MKRKILFIFGIVMSIAGIGLILYPIISQAYSANQQKKMMQEIKQEIISNLNTVNTNTAYLLGDSTPTPATGSAEEATLDIYDYSEGDDDTEAVAEDASETLSASRLTGQNCLGIITIDCIDLVYAVVEGVSNDNIGVAIGHFPDSVAIGQEGNCALAGHRGGTHGRYFGDLRKLVVGDEIVLTNLIGEEYTYSVTEYFIVDPSDYYVVQDLGTPGKYLTMVTCTSDGSQRYIVRAICTSEPTVIRDIK